ncbi:MAG: cadherin repeat domain-containing protein, partial [Psychrobium sp.]|nr:cadherin repeat domain-containing protein [Psychrobium sp.]
TSSDGSTSNEIFTINVGKNNSGAGGSSDVGAITDVDAMGSLVSENAIVGTLVGITAQAEDADVGDSVIYSLGDDAGGLFTIDSTTGVVSLANTLDFESATEHQITVIATSTDGSNVSEDFTIEVGDNDTGLGGGSTGGDNTTILGPVVDIDTSGDAATNLISENAVAGTAVGITASAIDIGDTVSYTLSDDAAGLFTIDSTTGIVTLVGALDFSLAETHSISIEATSSDGSTASESFIIAVGQNDDGAGDSTPVGAITDIDPISGVVSENAMIGTPVGITARAIDADITDSVTYSLQDDASGLFSIDANTGIIVLANSLDFENATSHDIIVLATSSDGSISTQTFTIAVGDNATGIGGTGTGDGTTDISPITDVDVLGDAATNLVSETASAGTLVGITAQATDVGDIVSYSLSDDAAGLFNIDSTTGSVSLVGELDYHSAQSHNITVLATSTDGSTSNEIFTIEVAQGNAGAGGSGAISDVIDVDQTVSVVSENAQIGTSVGITASATDVGDSITYTLDDDANGLFIIDSVTGVVTLANELDYETATSHQIIVLATSSGGSTSSEIFGIDVGNNDVGLGGGTSGGDNTNTVGPITDTHTTGDAATNLVSDNAAAGTQVGITALATDIGDTVTYTLSDSANGLFAIDGATGVVTLLGTLDYTVAQSHSITVLATSTDGSTSSEIFTVNVGDDSAGAGDGSDVSAIIDGDIRDQAISENAIVGTQVGITALATDSDPSDSISYSLSDDANGLFSIDASSGVVTLADTLDYETATSHDITILATSSDGSTSSEIFTVAVGDNDDGFGGGSIGGDNTPVIGPVSDINVLGDSATNLISQNATIGTAVGITASATDVGDTISYTLTDDAAGLFVIDSSTGIVTLAGVLDASITPTHDITVLATSSDGSTSSETFQINVGDSSTGIGDDTAVGDVVDIDATSGAVSENAAIGTQVGITAQALDADPNDIVTYRLDDNANGIFTIDATTGVVSLASNLDYETATAHNIIVKATSSDGSTAAATFVINVGDNDSGIGGGSTGGDNTTIIGPVTDIDITGDAASNLVSENAAPGTDVGITALAVDAGDSVTYSLSDNADGLFAIDGVTGAVFLLGNLDFSTAPSHDITVVATSSDGSTSSEIFTILVGDNNTGAGAGSDIGAVSDIDNLDSLVSENAVIGTDVGITANAIDSDMGDSITYSLTDDALGLFSIDSTTGVVSLANTLDFETAQTHNIVVVATSSDGTTSSETFNIAVGDNDNGIGGGSTGGDSTSAIGPITDTDTLGDSATNLISENALAGTAVGITANAVDSDLGDTVSYSLSDSDNGLFTIDSTSGVVSLVGTLDFEVNETHHITVLATSLDGSSTNEDFIINVGDNDNGAGGGNTGGDSTNAIGPVTDINVLGDAQTNLVSENASIGTPVGITAKATDLDVGDVITYTLTDDAAGLFSIDSATGVVAVAGVLDYETNSSHSISVLATSLDGSTSSNSFLIIVGDNDVGAGGGTIGGDNTETVGPIVDTDTTGDAATNLISENAIAGTKVGITALALDAGDTVTYTLTNNPGNLFAIDSGTGEVTLIGSLNYDTAILHEITVLATSTDNSTSTADFTINVGDNNTGAGAGVDIGPVTDVDTTTSHVSENAIVGTQIGITANATDTDVGDTISYSLSDNAGGLFSIDASSGIVSLANKLDFESLATHDITIVATSSDGSTSSELFTIDVGNNDTGIGGGSTGGDTTTDIGPVTDVNIIGDAETNLVSENASVGTAVGITALANDSDIGDTITYSLSDDANGLFIIDSTSGVVTTAATLDYETSPSHNLTVTATSLDGSESSAVFTVIVGDNNVGAGGGSTGGDNTETVGPITDTHVDGDAASNLVSENAIAGTEVGITALATDAGDTVTYTLVSNPNNLFSIDGSSGVVTLIGTLDFVLASTHDITVLATSTDGSTSTETFTINVGDNNTGAGAGSDIGPLIDIDHTVSLVSENAIVGTQIGIQANATDADVDDDISYSLDDNAGGLFSIDSSTGVVSLANTLDYETAQTHNITIVASSSDGTTSTDTFVIAVGNNDNGIGGGLTGGDSTTAIGPVTDLNTLGDAASNLVSENAAPGTDVGITANATDIDTGDTVSYSLSDDALGLFSIDSTSGVVSLVASLDHETSSTHTITVMATSLDGTTSSSDFVINVGDNDNGAGGGSTGGDTTNNVGAVIDTNTDGFSATNLVSENAAVGTEVGITANAVDDDLGDTVSYHLSDDAAGLFSIDSSSGVVTL